MRLLDIKIYYDKERNMSMKMRPHENETPNEVGTRVFSFDKYRYP